MRRTMNKCIYLLAGTFLLGACSADEVPTLVREEVEVKVAIDAPAQTRVNEAGDKFVNGDAFTLYMNGKPKGEGIDKSNYTSTDNKWAATTPLYWDDREGAPFCAVSPLPEESGSGYTMDTAGAGKDNYSVQVDQSNTESTKDNYVKSDLLIARSKATSRLLNIDFKHAFCRVVVKIVPVTTGSDAFTVDDFKEAVVTLNGKYIKAEIEYPTENNKADVIVATAVTASPEAAKDIVMRKKEATGSDLSSLEFAAIIPQQAVTLNGNTLLVTICNVKVKGIVNKYTYKPKDSELTKPVADVGAFTQGKQTTITINLKKKSITGKISITPWGEGPTGTDNGAIVLPTN